MGKLALGQRVKDSLSPFTGTITAICEYATGTTRIQVTASALNAEGRAPEEWFDEARLELFPKV